MSSIPYTYCLLRYVHDVAAGESLNIGVLVFSADHRFAKVLLEARYERLSRAFANFDGDSYKESIHAFSAALERIRGRWEARLFDTAPLPNDAHDLACQIWPDPDLSFQVSSLFGGICSDLNDTLQHLFHSYVTSQAPHTRTERRTDELIWPIYRDHLGPYRRALQPKTFVSTGFEQRFEHTFRNGLWHVLQPLSLDMAQSDSVQRKAVQWFGCGSALSGSSDVAHLYLLLGKPQLEKLKGAYNRAKDLLHRIPVPHTIYEEDEAVQFGEELTLYMAEHGVVGSDNEDQLQLGIRQEQASLKRR